MAPADVVQAGDERREGTGPVPVARLHLVLLGVQVLLVELGCRRVLEQLVAAVDPVGRHQRGREHQTQLERGTRAEPEGSAEDVGRARPEVGPHVVGLRPVAELLEVRDELVLERAPCEVRVALAEADLGQLGHHRRPGERLGQEDHVGVVALHRGDQPLPERDRLRVRVVDAEGAHAVADPEVEDALARVPQRGACG